MLTKEGKSMTKKEVKNFFTREALTLLEANFNIDIDGGGRTIKFLVEVNGVDESGCIGRDDLEVMLDNTIRLHNPEDFPAEYVKQHQECVRVEDKMNELLEELKEEYTEIRRNS